MLQIWLKNITISNFSLTNISSYFKVLYSLWFSSTSFSTVKYGLYLTITTVFETFLKFSHKCLCLQYFYSRLFEAKLNLPFQKLSLALVRRELLELTFSLICFKYFWSEMNSGNWHKGVETLSHGNNTAVIMIEVQIFVV